ncbi:hypothetical protein J1C56_01805 [Aminobacter anthyllidis]|uniref:Uncharacterized protein n=1 Tax=Aminobacter anthyllidis TaxID=1035067 RepID=A0A9X1A6P5_9HYPH|nr:hypothetical protein [Aminobacter anthyllidis]MBT1154319.1 hypothetical protein [Aminobacter anthyllidis]
MNAHFPPQYAWYFKALAMAGDCGELTRSQLSTLGISEGDPQPGFYRKRTHEDGPFVPVAIWNTEGGMVALVGGAAADPSNVWSFCARHPVSEATYNAVDAGANWPDADPVVAEQIAGTGHNSATVDEAEALRDQIDAARKGNTYKVINDDETLAKAQGLRSRLLELKGEAEKKHKKEKEPHLEAGRVVDRKWLPLAKDAEAEAKSIRGAMDGWETKKLHLRREADRQAETARLAAEQARIAAERADETFDPVDEPVTQPVAASAPTPIKGSYGRAASVSVVNVVTAITDQKALYEFLKDHPDLKDCMFDLAKRAVAKGHTVPGVSVEEQAKVA